MCLTAHRFSIRCPCISRPPVYLIFLVVCRYEGRCALPSNFDSTYCYVLGAAAGALLGGGRTGVMATATDLHLPSRRWRVGGTPLVTMMNMELRHGK